MYFQLGKIYFTGRFRTLLVFVILTIAPLIWESLLGNTPIAMAILQKRVGNFLSETSTISLMLIFGDFIFVFDVRCVSRKCTSCTLFHLSRK